MNAAVVGVAPRPKSKDGAKAERIGFELVRSLTFGLIELAKHLFGDTVDEEVDD